MQNSFLNIPHAINGDTVIGFTDVKGLKTMNYFDAPKVASYLMSNEKGVSQSMHLGLINLMASTHTQPMPLLKDLFENSAVLEVNPGQSVTYDLPVSRASDDCYTAEDTSAEQDKPGIDGTVFSIILNQEFTKGTTITFDLQDGVEAMVSNEHSPEQVGDNFKHYLVLSTNSKVAFFPKEFLKTGIRYFKVDHIIGELETDYGNITMTTPPMSTMTCEFVLGDPRGIESFMTNKASQMSAPGLADYAKNTHDRMAQQMEVINGGNNNTFFMGKIIKNAQGVPMGVKKGSVSIGSTLEYFGLAELAMMETISLSYSKGGTFRTAQGGTKRRNEGIYPQMRRGKIIKYAVEGGITRNHLHEAAQYIFKNNPMPIEKRWIKFRVGTMAHMNIMQLIREEALQQFTNLPQGMLGTMGQIGPVFTGQLNDLKMEYVAITQVMFPGIGNVMIEHDPALDYKPFTDRASSGFYGAQGFADTSYTAVIWDATMTSYSNVNEKVKGADLIEGGKKNANIYYVKPVGPNLTYGYEQGRMANRENFTDVMSSVKTMSKTFWAHQQSEALLLDTTRQVWIELQRIGNNR